MEKPILMSTEMVEAILEGRKTKTRRIIKGGMDLKGMNFTQLINHGGNIGLQAYFDSPEDKRQWGTKCKYNVGDILYVRETWANLGYNDCEDGAEQKDVVVYKASQNGGDWDYNITGWRWRPAIFMPKTAARIFLKITNISVERVQDITEEDAEKEGMERGIFREGPNTSKKEFHFEINKMAKFLGGFKYLWHKINGRESWDSNPYVWVITFEVLSKEGNPVERSVATAV